MLSGGRVVCGIGLGWFEEEHTAYGWPFPSRAERYALLGDALQLLPQMWGPGGKPFDGRVLHVPDTSCYPRPLQAHVPILVGGSGERRTLRLVAEHADACNLFGEPDVVAHKVAVLAGTAPLSVATRRRSRSPTSARCWSATTGARRRAGRGDPAAARRRPNVTPAT